MGMSPFKNLEYSDFGPRPQRFPRRDWGSCSTQYQENDPRGITLGSRISARKNVAAPPGFGYDEGAADRLDPDRGQSNEPTRNCGGLDGRDGAMRRLEGRGTGRSGRVRLGGSLAAERRAFAGRRTDPAAPDGRLVDQRQADGQRDRSRDRIRQADRAGAAHSQAASRLEQPPATGAASAATDRRARLEPIREPRSGAKGPAQAGLGRARRTGTATRGPRQ